MDIFLTVYKRDFNQQTITVVPPPAYLVTGHQIRSLPPADTAKKKEGGGGESGRENLQGKQTCSLNWKNCMKIQTYFSLLC